MAGNSYAATLSAVDKTLVANQVDTVTFDHDLENVEVLSDGAAKLYFTVDGSVPTVGGSETFVLLAAPGSRRTVQVPTAGNTVVKLVSPGTPVYSVTDAKAGSSFDGGAGVPIAASGNIRRTVTTHGTAVKVNATTLPIKRAVVCALSTNTGIVVVGGSGVLAAVGTRNAPYLNAGDMFELGAVDLTNVYVDSTVDGEGVTVYFEA